MDRQLVVSVTASIVFLVIQLSSGHSQVMKGFVHHHIKTPSPHPIEASPCVLRARTRLASALLHLCSSYPVTRRPCEQLGSCHSLPAQQEKSWTKWKSTTPHTIIGVLGSQSKLMPWKPKRQTGKYWEPQLPKSERCWGHPRGEPDDERVEAVRGRLWGSRTLGGPVVWRNVILLYVSLPGAPSSSGDENWKNPFCASSKGGGGK